MEYHYSKNPIVLREYGRNVQIMAEIILDESDPQARKEKAEDVVHVMSTLLPSNKDQGEYKRKLWEQLYKLTNYKLELDNPPYIIHKPTEKEEQERSVVKYSKREIKFKQYGRNVELLIEMAIDLPEGKEKDLFIINIANIMKQQLHSSNSNFVSDTIIFDHLYKLSKGEIKLKSSEIQLKQTSGYRNNNHSGMNSGKNNIKKERKRRKTRHT